MADRWTGAGDQNEPAQLQEGLGEGDSQLGEAKCTGNCNGRQTKIIYAHSFSYFIVLHLLNLYPDLIMLLLNKYNCIVGS